MRIFLASTAIDDIRWATDNGLADGVFTTPAALSLMSPDGDYLAAVAAICSATTVPVAVSVAHVDPDEIYRDGRELARVADHVIVQIPFVEDAIGAIRRLTSDGVRVAATLVFSAAQALVASKVGAIAVVTSLADLEAQGEDAAHTVRAMRGVLDADGHECDVIAAYARGAAQFASIAAARADAVVLDVETLRTLLLHPLTDRGMDQLLGDLSRRTKPHAQP